MSSSKCSLMVMIGLLFFSCACMAFDPNEPGDDPNSNHPPEAVDDIASTEEDTAVEICILDNDKDMDQGTIELVLRSNGAFGSVLRHDRPGTQCVRTSVMYFPNLNFHGQDGFEYTISDQNGAIAFGNVDVTVTSVNDPPVARDDLHIQGAGAISIIRVLANDTDVEDQEALMITGYTQGINGTVAIDGEVLTYTPSTPNFTGEDQFQYTIRDQHGETATAQVMVRVESGIPELNTPPQAHDDPDNSTSEDTLVSIEVLGNDTDLDNDTLVITSVTQGAHGTVMIRGRAVAYMPSLKFHGTDHFTYTISDNRGGSDTAQVTVTVAPVNDPPIARDDVRLTTRQDLTDDTFLEIAVLMNDSDIDNDPLEIVDVTQGTNGKVEIVSEGNQDLVKYTPNTDFFGEDQFQYTIRDPHGSTATAVVTVTVRQQPLCPSAGSELLELLYGDLLSCEISERGGMDAFQFVGSVDDQVRILVAVEDGAALDPCVELRDPQGHVDLNCDSGGAGENSQIDKHIDLDGTYTITVRAEEENVRNLGSYTLNMVRIPPAPSVQRVLEAGIPTTGAIDIVGDSDLFTFDGCRGEVVRLSMTRDDDTPLLIPTLELFDPQGGRLDLSGNSGQESSAELPAQNLPSDGTYTVVARDRLNKGVGRYLLMLEKLLNQECRNMEMKEIERPGAMAFVEQRNELYVISSPLETSTAQGSLFILDIVSNDLVATIDLGLGFPQDIVASPDGDAVYVAISDFEGEAPVETLSRIVTVDTISRELVMIVDEMDGLDFPTKMVISPKERRIYVTDRFIDLVHVVDIISSEVTSSIPIQRVDDIREPSIPFGIDITPDGRRVYVANRSAATVTVIDTSINAVADTIPLGLKGANTSSVAMMPDGSRAYVTLGEMGDPRIAVIGTDVNNPASFNQIIETIPVQSGMEEMAFNGDGSRAYVVNSRTDELFIINTDPNVNSLNRVQSVDVGRGPVDVVLTSISPTTLHVSNTRSNSISVVMPNEDFCSETRSILDFENFRNIEGLVPNGDGVRRIRDILNIETGSVWHEDKQFVQNCFETRFKFRITNKQGVEDCVDEIGGDGFAFVIQNESVTALGGDGGNLGYGGIRNSIAVEFDTYCNAEIGDPPGEHISVHTNGTEPNGSEIAFSLGFTNNIPELSDGQIHDVTIKYLPGELEIILDNNSVLKINDIDLGEILDLDNGRAFVGFTAGETGVNGATENHQFLDWFFAGN